MRIPTDPQQLLDRGVVLTWHGGWRLCERAGVTGSERLEKVAVAMIGRGTILGGQYRGELGVLAESEQNGRKVVLILKPTRGPWIVSTVLTESQFNANLSNEQSRHRAIEKPGRRRERSLQQRGRTMTPTVFILLVLAFATGFLCCFLIWQSADRSARLLREHREVRLEKLASQSVVDDLIAGQTEYELACYYGVAQELIVDLRNAGGLDSSHQWKTEVPA